MNQLATGDQNGVFENSGRFFSMNFRDLEIMPVQVKRMHVVTFVDENEPVAATKVNLDRFALDGASDGAQSMPHRRDKAKRNEPTCGDNKTIETKQLREKMGELHYKTIGDRLRVI